MTITANKAQTQFLAFLTTFVVAQVLLAAVLLVSSDACDRVVGERGEALVAGVVVSVIYGAIGAGCWVGSVLIAMRVRRCQAPSVMAACTVALFTQVAFLVWHGGCMVSLLAPLLVAPVVMGMLVSRLGSDSWAARVNACVGRGIDS